MVCSTVTMRVRVGDTPAVSTVAGLIRWLFDPRNKCVIYSSFANTIRKSVDCNRSFREVYIDTRAEQFITTLAVDSFNNLLVYAGNTGGDILKSFDGGSNWQVINPLEKQR